MDYFFFEEVRKDKLDSSVEDLLSLNLGFYLLAGLVGRLGDEEELALRRAPKGLLISQISL